MSCNSIRIHVDKYTLIPYGHNRNGINSIQIVTTSGFISTIKFFTMLLVLFLSVAFFVFLTALMTIWLIDSDYLLTVVYVVCEARALIAKCKQMYTLHCG